MGLACVTLKFYFRKGEYVGHLQWDIMRKYPTELSNIYGYEVLGMGDTVFTRVGKNFTETACLNQGTWFGKFMMLYKLCVVVIKKQYFGVTSEMVKDMLVGWYIVWKIEVNN